MAKPVANLEASSKVLLALLSAGVGLALVIAAFKISWLNWVVDGPGWLVGRVVPIDFHEGDGALGFVLALLLSWLLTTVASFFLAAWLWGRVQPTFSSRSRTR